MTALQAERAANSSPSSRSRPQQSHQPHRYAFIDSLRGLAALSVLYLHAAELLEKKLVPKDFDSLITTALTKFIDIGKVGVIVFFAISGFVIPFTLMNRSSTVVGFIINRCFRLYPAYWLSIIFMLFISLTIEGAHIPLHIVLINFTMLQQFFLQQNILDSYWTLQVEIIFYAFCIVLFVRGIIGNQAKFFLISLSLLCIALLLAVGRFITHVKAPVALPMGLSVMFWGSILRSFRIEGDRSAKQFARLMLAIYFVFVPLISLLAYNFNAGYEETWYRYTASYFTAITTFYIFTGRIRIVGRIWSWLGQISYSVYLFHPIITSIFMVYIAHIYRNYLSIHIYIFIIMTMTLIFSHFTHAYIEAPCVALGRTLNRYLGAWMTSTSRVIVRNK